MRKNILVIFLWISSFVVLSQTHWKVATSSVTFKIKNGGMIVDGSFGGLIADITFDPSNYAKSFMEASMDVNTINTGIDLRNSHLKKEGYFNASKYPKISLKSTLFSKESDGTFKGFFKLTMKGITKDIVIPFSYTESTNNAIFKASFNINRRDYNVGGNSWTMSDDVSVNIVINATK